MRLEERLTRHLHDEADAHEVDLTRLYAGTRDRIAERAAPTRRRSWARPALMAATVAAVLGAVVSAGVLGLRTVDRGGPAAQMSEEGVNGVFDCPRQHTIPFDGSSDDDSFLPSLDDGPAAMAQFVQAPTYELAIDGDRAVLLLGNADRSLASLSTFARAGDRWDPLTATVCRGEPSILVPVEGAGALGDHGGPLVDQEGALDEGDFGPRAVRLDDRAYYDASGLVHRRSMWAEPCGARLCVSAGRDDSYARTSVKDGTKPTDLTSVFLPADDMVGQRPPFALVGVQDPDGEVTAVSWTSRDGRSTTVPPSREPGWPGQHWFLLVPYDELEGVTVATATGEQVYDLADMR